MARPKFDDQTYENILIFIKEHPYATLNEVSRGTGYDKRTISKHVNIGKKRGLVGIQKIGKAKAVRMI